MRDSSFNPWPCFSEEEIEAAAAVLRSGKVNYWTGNQGKLFEQEFAAYHNRRYALAVANGTVALELGLAAMGIGPGDEVIVPSRTFIASASSAVMRGAIPVCADVSAESQTLTSETIRASITPKTKAVVAVHLAGWCCDMDPILSLAEQHGLQVLEDCAQSHGAKYKGRLAGSMGDAGAFSFCQDKIMSTGGEGGMLLTDDSEIFERAWSLRDHGKSHALCSQLTSTGQGFRWLHESFGTNWRLTEMQSAIGRVLLRRLEQGVELRRRNASILTQHFRTVPGLRVTEPPDYIQHAYYKYYAFIRPEMLNPEWSRDRIITAINAQGIPCFSGSCSEIYMEKAFDSLAAIRPSRRMPVARSLGETSLMFLVHPTLSERDMLETCRVVESVMSEATWRMEKVAA